MEKNSRAIKNTIVYSLSFFLIAILASTAYASTGIPILRWSYEDGFLNESELLGLLVDNVDNDGVLGAGEYVYINVLSSYTPTPAEAVEFAAYEEKRRNQQAREAGKQALLYTDNSGIQRLDPQVRYTVTPVYFWDEMTGQKLAYAYKYSGNRRTQTSYYEQSWTNNYNQTPSTTWQYVPLNNASNYQNYNPWTYTGHNTNNYSTNYTWNANNWNQNSYSFYNTNYYNNYINNYSYSNNYASWNSWSFWR